MLVSPATVCVLRKVGSQFTMNIFIGVVEIPRDYKFAYLVFLSNIFDDRFDASDSIFYVFRPVFMIVFININEGKILGEPASFTFKGAEFVDKNRKFKFVQDVGPVRGKT